MNTIIRDIGELLKKDFVLSFRSSILLSIFYLFTIPVIRGISNLDPVQSAQCLEQSVSLIGALMIIPLTKWEHNVSVKELIATKPKAYIQTVCLRLVIALLLIVIMTTGFALIMLMKNCMFPLKEYVIGTILISCLIGLFGLLLSQIGRNVIIGYLGAFGYYSLCKLGVLTANDSLYLFPLSSKVNCENICLLLSVLTILFIFLLFTIIKKQKL